jgi:hypothetical protein
MRAPTFSEAFGVAISQSEADFVVPDLATDIPVCIDPFLLFKSRDPYFRELHEQLLNVFRHAFDLHGAGDRASLDRLIDFPEVSSIGFGYTKGRWGGSGLGWQLNRLLADLLAASADIRYRGLRHVEELQLLAVGVGPDRVSDIAANVLKLQLVQYTQEQSNLWGIPLQKGAPLAHYLNHDEMEWEDGYYDLPINPLSGDPLLLVPRRIVRLLPWINYDDFCTSEARLLLPPRARLPRYPGQPAEERAAVAKEEMVAKLRERPTVLDAYISRKERTADRAVPVLQDADDAHVEATATDLIQRLDAIPTGVAAATEYQRLVYEVLNFLFEPELTGGQLEVLTYMGTERRDIVYWNEAEQSFWAYVRETYLSPLVMFEVKNVNAVEIEHVNQTATYLGARLGMLGFIVTRNAPSDAVIRKTYSVFNDTPTPPRRIVIVLSDADLRAMINERVERRGATPYVQAIYRTFRQRVQ